MMKKKVDLTFCEWTKPGFKCMYLSSHVTTVTTQATLTIKIWKYLAKFNDPGISG